MSEETRRYFRRWKEAEIGCWRIEGVIDNYLTLRPWCVESGQAEGEQLRAISLGMGGAQFFADAVGKVLVGYPPRPRKGRPCSCGLYDLQPRGR